MSFLSHPPGTSLPVDFDPFAGGELSSTVSLTESQREIWASVQMGAAASCSYNESQSLALKGDLREKTLLQAFQGLVDRHEVLRATCSPDGLTLCIARELALKVDLTDLSHLDFQAQTQQVDDFSQQAVETPFDLEHGPLIRVKLIKLSDQNHVLLLTVHHIICDGWSIALMISDLAELYTAFQQGQAPQLDPPVGFSEYANALEDAKGTTEAQEDFSYWLEQYTDSVPTLDFPTDRPRPALRTFDSARVDWQLSPELITQLKKLGTELGGSFMTTLLSGFEIYLARITGQSDITVGVPAAGQAATGEYNLVGHCVNLLPLRSQVNTEQSFQAYFNNRKSTVLDAYDHQQFTFGTLVQAVRMDRDPSRIPLVPIIFNIDQGLDSEQLSFADLEVTFKSNPRSYENFELFINATELKGAVTLECQYNTNLFDRETIQRRLAEFETILLSIITNPAQPIATLSLLPEAERHQLLVSWNSTQKEYADECLHTLFEAQVEKTPDAIAVVFEDQQLTYRALNHRANQLAHYLKSLGIKPDQLVGICLDRSLEMVTGLLGVLKAGGAYVPLDPSYPAERLAFMLEDAQVPVLLTSQSQVQQLSDYSGHLLCLDRDWQTLAELSEQNPLNGCQSDNLAYVIYTSGSTGKPKGTMNTHRGIVNRLLWMQDEYALNTSDRVLQKTPFSFDVSVWELFWPLLTGAKLIMAKPEGHKDPSYLSHIIAQAQITTLHFVPSMLQVFLTAAHLDQCHSLQRVICSGEALSLDLQHQFFQRLDCELHNLYGPTEAAIDVSFWQCQPELSLPAVPIGRPVANTQLYILDAALQPLPIGVPGELHIGGVQLAQGYLHRPDLTTEKFIWHEELGTRLYKTGDLCCYQPNGTIEYRGRIDHQVKIRGLRIELGEIEANLRQHPAVQDAVVVVREDLPSEQILVGYVIGQCPQDQEIHAWIAEIRHFIKSRLPDFMIPNYLMLLGSFPLTPNGKVDRRSLPQPDTAQQLATNHVAPRNPLEVEISTIWSEVFKQESIGIHDNFFDLGGYSLLAIQIVARIRQSLDVEILLPHLLESPTIAELAQRVEVIRWSIQGQGQPDPYQTQGNFEEGEL